MTAAPVQAISGRMPEDARRAMLLDVPDHGRVTRLGGRIVLDFSPALRGAERYLWSFSGRPFLDESHAEEVRQTICADARHLPLADAVARFRGRRSRSHRATTVIDRYLEAAPGLVSERTDRRLAPRTLGAYRRVLDRSRPFFEGLTIHEATQADTLRRWKAWFRRPVSEGGRGLASDQEGRNAFAAFRAVVAWYRTTRRDFPEPDWPSMPTALTAKRRNRARREAERHLSLAEVVQVIERVPEDRRAIFWIMFYTGARPTEARGILVRDWARPRLTIRRSAAGDLSSSEVRDWTKTEEEGSYDLPSWLCEMIDRTAKPNRLRLDAPLCPPHRKARGALVSYDALRDLWVAASEAAGVPVISVYRAMKHTQVSALRAAGLSLEEIVDQYRWTGPAMVEHYDERKNERRGGVVKRLDELVGKARGAG